MDQDPDLGPGPDVHGSGQGNRVRRQVGLASPRQDCSQQSQEESPQSSAQRPSVKRRGHDQTFSEPQWTPQNETRFSRELPSTVTGRGGPV